MSLDQPGVELFEGFATRGLDQEETATPVFIGFTEKGQPGSLFFVETLTEFSDQLGGPLAPAQASDLAPVLFHTARHYFDNGGGGCFVCPLGNYAELEGLSGDALIARLDDERIRQTVAGERRIALVAVPDLVLLDGLSVADDGSTWSRAWRSVLELCESRRGLFGLLDTPASPELARQCAQRFCADVNSERRAWVSAYWPRLVTDYERSASPPESALAARARGASVLAVATSAASVRLSYTGAQASGDQERAIASVSVRADDSTRKWKEVRASAFTWEVVPASGAVAAKIGECDRDRGIWTAPANLALSRVVKPISPQLDADDLYSETGVSINLIRSFPGRGVRIWGCRTLADGTSTYWRYLQVRRLVGYIETSLAQLARFVVFEPNNEITWAKLKGQTLTWLRALWMRGALAGVNEKDAFSVLVGLDESMTRDDIAVGRLVMTVDLAVLAPAEFIQINLQFHTGETQTRSPNANRYEGEPS